MVSRIELVSVADLAHPNQNTAHASQFASASFALDPSFAKWCLA